MKAAGLLCACTAGLLWGCGHLGGAAGTEAVWEGTVEIRGVERIPRGSTLVILPGTRILFAFLDTDGDGLGEAGLLVEGRVIARGTAGSPVTFEAGDGDFRPGRWGEIRIESREPSLFSHCRFRGGGTAIHSHFSPLTVEASLFADNAFALRFRGDPVVLRGNIFTENGTAVRYWESSPEITANIIRGNGTGIFCRQGSPGTVARGNNFLDNLDYHVKLGELQEDDVDARFNYWGEVDRGAIEKKIFDREDAGYLGRVRFEPWEPAPFPLEEAWREARRSVPPPPGEGSTRLRVERKREFGLQ